MEDLEIKIAVKVPINNLTFNGLLRGLEIDRDPIMRFIIGPILQVVEKKAKEDYPPDRYVQYAHQSAVRKFLTSFGEFRHCLAQVRTRKKGIYVFSLSREIANRKFSAIPAGILGSGGGPRVLNAPSAGL